MEPFLTENIQSNLEELASKRLRTHLEKKGQHGIEKNLEELLVGDGYIERFHLIEDCVGGACKERLLISGCAVGTEHLVARNFGFREIYGTEVIEEYVEIAKMRLSAQEGMFVDLYDGKTLPYEDAYFSFVYSGHIIEHTPSPFGYFCEHLRVLKPGGVMFLEFPNRYHHTELHTGTVSFEWMPEPFRSVCLRVMSSRFLPGNVQKKKYYEAVRTTLKPISVWQLKAYTLVSGSSKIKILQTQVPAPGFMRVMLRKEK